MGNKVTGDIGNSVGCENALEKRVTNGRVIHDKKGPSHKIESTPKASGD